MVCKKCGASLSEGSLFCSHCGTKAESAPATPSSGNSWFTPAGGLDDQLTGTPVRKKEISEEMPKPPVRKEPVRPIVTPVREETVESVVTPVTPRFVPSEASGEKRFCRKCGAEISTGSSFCSKCGFDANSEKPAGFSMTNWFGSVGEFVKKYKKPLLIGVAACLVLVIAIALFNIGGPKSEKEIMEDIGEDITVLFLGNERIQLYVEDLEIEKRKTKDDLDQVYCKIEMANDNIAVTSYQLMTYSKYNGNKWIFEVATPYEAEKIEILEPTSVMYDNVVNRIEYGNSLLEGFDSMVDDYNVTCSGNTAEYEFEVSKTIGVLSTSGTIYATSEIRGDRAEGYYMSTSVDDSNLTTKWNVEGTWSGHETNYGTGWYELTITVNSLTPEAINCSWEYDYDGWEKHDYYGDGDDCWIIESDDECIKVGVRYGTALIGSSLYVYFYTDGSAQVEFPFIGVGDMSKS